ncbi:MAG TPA: porin family protein [Chitinophagaceae bacterium]|nr:porin family protein [Chitinophagaceae bacterium]
MKTKLFSLAFMLFICSASFSQGLTFGIKGGATFNKLTGKSFKEEFSFGYHVGAFATLGMGGKLSLQPEVLFNQVNQDTSSSFSSVYQFNRIDKVQLKYLSIPILINYNLSNLLALQLGPQFGILIDQNENMLQNGSDAFKKGDFSMIGGLQLKLLKFRVYGRYVVGLNDISNIGNKDQWKSQSIQLGVGVAL